ncbi:MAG: iron-containing alcohol dehydrogenase [Pyramidobacter sp.]|jgi:alcohol dehydrogenase YqhD (iron-dependent ADH family)
MQDFVFSSPVKTWFGAGAAQKALRASLPGFGRNVMLCMGGGSVRKNGIYDEIMDILRECGKRVVEFSGIMPNPTWKKVCEGAQLARREKVDLVLAVGGGSVSDCCKMICAQAVTDEDLWTMKFDFGALPAQFLPLGVVVTASGTGSEQNNIAVITNEEKKIKAGMTGATPAFAALDPSSTLSVPFAQVLSGAFDTLSHCMESYFGTPRDENLTDEIAEAVMRHVIGCARDLASRPKDVELRGELMWAAALAENGLLKAGKVTDFQAHQIEHQVGAYTDCNHGQGLAVIQPVLYRHLYRGAPQRFARWAQRVWNVEPRGGDLETASAGVDALRDFVVQVGLPDSFRKMGIKDRSFYGDVARSCRIMPGCCRQLSVGEIFDILTECY